MSYLDRYLAGEHEQVWAELVALGAAVREEPLYADALPVARETMRRTRHNIETLIPRLRELEYRFGYEGIYEGKAHDAIEHDPPVFAPPATDVQDVIGELEARHGILPLSMRVLYETVGSVDFVGTPPDRWGLQGDDRYTLDPLFLFSAKSAQDTGQVWDDVDRWLANDGLNRPTLNEAERLDGKGVVVAPPQDRFLVPIAPDEYFKFGYSGGGLYNITVPNLAADAPLLNEWHHTTFVDYLRICFRWGGLPGLQLSPNPPLRDLAYLTEGLLPI